MLDVLACIVENVAEIFAFGTSVVSYVELWVWQSYELFRDSSTACMHRCHLWGRVKCGVRVRSAGN